MTVKHDADLHGIKHGIRCIYSREEFLKNKMAEKVEKFLFGYLYVCRKLIKQE